ncbi:MAG: DNA polymerase I [Bacteroidales bacterium]
MKKLFLLDAYALIFRAYYAMIKTPRITSNGLNTSAIFGFVNTLQEILKKENPTHIAVCFDLGGKTFRHELYEPYKGTREETPEDIRKAVPYIKDILRAYNIPIVEQEGYEADDLIGTLACEASRRGFDTYMMTPDKDFGQLVAENIKIFKPSFRGGGFEVRGVEQICAKYQIESPLQVIDILALMGDKVDNIPGCPGVGEVTAIKLLKEFGSVENLIENSDKLKGAIKVKVTDNAEQIKLSKILATIKVDVPIEFNEQELQRAPINETAMREIFQELEFRTFINRILGEKSAESTAEASAIVAEEVAVTPAIDLSEAIVIDTISMLRKVVAVGLKQSEVGIHIYAEGSESMTAALRGIALAIAGKSYYLDLSGGYLDDLTTLLCSDKVCKVGVELKRAYIILKNIGVELSAPYYDISVAHYIIQPEMSHDIERLSESELKTELASLDVAKGKRGAAASLFNTVDDSQVAKYATQRAEVALLLKAKFDTEIAANSMANLLNDIELPLIAVLAEMEMAGIRIDVATLKESSTVMSAKISEIEAECWDLAGEKFNTASPMQVGEVLFDRLKIDEKAKKTKSGQYSTTEEVMTKLLDRHPIVAKILELRGLRKLLSTYINALPELINPSTGAIHTTFNQTVTATGRLSSTNPNMQNIPVRTDEGREIRRAFIPSDGNIFFSADYSQIELRLVADMSGDETMIDAFNHEKDIHQITASKIYHEALEEVTAEQRRNAKTANFGILYGISAFGLSQRLDIPRSEAKMLIDGYYATYPRVQEFMDESLAKAKECGYVTTIFGRRRLLPEINSKNAIVRSFSERNAINAPIQGSAADLIKIAMIRIYKRFSEQGLKSKMIMQVHDELNFDVIPAELPQVTEIVTEEMQNAYTARIPLTVSYSQGANWAEAH